MEFGGKICCGKLWSLIISAQQTDAERLFHGFHECLEVVFNVVHYYIDLVHVTTNHNLLRSDTDTHRHNIQYSIKYVQHCTACLRLVTTK